MIVAHAMYRGIELMNLEIPTTCLNHQLLMVFIYDTIVSEEIHSTNKALKVNYNAIKILQNWFRLFY